MDQNLLTVFFTVLVTEFAAEFGDKTQLILVGMTSKYKIRQIILGFLPAVILLNAIAVFIGGALNQVLNSYLWAVKFAAALAFLYFAVSSLSKEEECEEGEKECKIKFAPLAVFTTFFVAELGDKTQLTALTFGANYGLSGIFTVFFACVIGFFAADFIGMMVGLLLKKKAPDGILKIVSFALFAFFGLHTVYQALMLLQDSFTGKGIETVVPVWTITALACVGFSLICLGMVYLNKKKSLSTVAVEVVE